MEHQNLLPEMSEKSDVVLVQLMKAKREMGSSVKKDSTNPFHKSKYASLGAHLDLCESVLDNHGLLMLHSENRINNEHILIATLLHPESGQWIKSYLPLLNVKGDCQGVGAAISYMRRYSMNSMLGLSAEDDDGEVACGRGKNQAKEKETPPPAPTVPQEVIAERIGKAEIVALNGLLTSLDAQNQKSFLDFIGSNFGAKSLQDIPKASFKKCLDAVNLKIQYLKEHKKAVA